MVQLRRIIVLAREERLLSRRNECVCVCAIKGHSWDSYEGGLLFRLICSFACLPFTLFDFYNGECVCMYVTYIL